MAEPLPVTTPPSGESTVDSTSSTTTTGNATGPAATVNADTASPLLDRRISNLKDTSSDLELSRLNFSSAHLLDGEGLSNSSSSVSVDVNGKQNEESVPSGEDTKAEPKQLTEKKKPNPPREHDFDWGETFGEGAFGVVKQATEKKTGQQYAVKIIDKKFILEKKNKEVVFRERNILNELNHPFIVKLFYTFTSERNLFFVMELCPGGELWSLWKKLGSFNVECTRHYAAEIIVALEYIHSKGIIHRDLKPENILLGKDRHIRLIDFGTAKKIGETRESRSSSFEGTPEYMSPELLNDKSCGKASDLWALGVTVYQLLSGRLPFRGELPYHVFQQVINHQLVFPESGFPEQARDLVEKLLESDPDKRLGNGPNGYADLKAHPFFSGIDWAALPTTTPPTLAALNPPCVFRETPPAAAAAASAGTAPNTPASPSKFSAEELEKWRKFLKGGEEIIEMGLVVKKRGLSKTRRQLILTNAPRLLYLDPQKGTVKGEIAWSDDEKNCRVEVKGDAQFFIHTPSRSWNLTAVGFPASRWSESITKLQQSRKAFLAGGTA